MIIRGILALTEKYRMESDNLRNLKGKIKKNNL